MDTKLRGGRAEPRGDKGLRGKMPTAPEKFVATAAVILRCFVVDTAAQQGGFVDLTGGNYTRWKN